MISFAWLLRLAHLSPPPSTSFVLTMQESVSALRCAASSRRPIGISKRYAEYRALNFLGRHVMASTPLAGVLRRRRWRKGFHGISFLISLARSHELSRSFNPRHLGMWTQFSRVILFALVSLWCKLCVGKGHGASARRPKCR